jgi:hypothetical protein
MATKLEIIAKLKTEYPTLKAGDDEQGYTDLEPADYEATLSKWADNQLADEAKIAQEAIEATAKVALLKRLGLTADEARLLLG